MRVVVDFDLCAATGGCQHQAPEVFELRDDGMLHVLDATPPESLRAKVQQAIDYCPTGRSRSSNDDVVLHQVARRVVRA